MNHIEKCISACYACSAACEKCATLCLSEDDVKKLIPCILLDRECSALCLATAKILSIGADNFQMLCKACEDMCNVCAKECGKHAHMHHCKQCAEACRYCAEMCNKLIIQDTP
jgi:uncharacterized protein DUF326